MKKIILVIGLVVVLVTSLLVGCTDKELSQEEIVQLVNDVLITNAGVKTVKFNMNAIQNIKMIGGPQPEGAIAVGEGTGAIDSTNRKMQMIIDMNVDVAGEGRQSMPMETYLVDGWMHIKVSVEETGAQWVKMQLPDEMWDSQSQIDLQINLLETAKRVSFLGSEDVNGMDCYVVEIVPCTEILNKMLSQIQMPGMEEADLSQFNFTDAIKDMSFKQWIAQDDYLILKSETNVTIEMTPEDIGVDTEKFQKVAMEQNTVMVFYDYNEPVSITLPAEALE
jgi:hypothetical protein